MPTMLRSRPSSALATWLARQAKTLAGGPCNEEAKKEKRRRRRETNLRLKEWVSNQDMYWAASKAKGGLKEQQREEEEDVEWQSDARLWERLIKDARSGTQRKRILKAYRQWQRASSNGQEEQWWAGSSSFSWSPFSSEHFWWGGRQQGTSQGAASGRQHFTAGAWSCSWEDLFGEQESWWERDTGRRATGSDQQQQQRHRQRRQQQQQGRGAVGGSGRANSEVASSLRALGLTEGTQLTGVVLKEAFRRRAMQWHPDRHPDAGSKAQAEVRFKEAQAAFQLLTSLVVS